MFICLSDTENSEPHALPLQQDEVLRDQHFSEKSTVSVSESSHEEHSSLDYNNEGALEETL